MRRYNKNKLGYTCLCSVGLALLQANPAHAQVSESGGRALDEVIVTARRDLESAQKVPLSVVVLDEKVLEQKNVRNSNDLASVAPGLSVQNTSSNRNTTTYSIRGQGQTFGQNSPGVIAYFAEVPDFSSGFFYDLNGVQVLKGPQGTLFGRNTNGGAILFTPKEPTEKFDGYVSARMGNYNRLDYEAAVGGAVLPDLLRVRFATQRINRSGFTDNVNQGGWADNENRSSYRFSAILQPSDKFENYFIYQYENIREAGSGQSIGKINNSGANAAVFPILQAALNQQEDAGPRKMFVTANWPTYVGSKSRGIINSTTWDLNDYLTLKNILSYRRYDVSTSYDLDGTPLPWLQVTNPYAKNQPTERTEEFQVQGHFDNLETVLGYYHESAKAPLRTFYNSLQFVALQAKAFTSSDNGSEAYFGQAKYNLTDDLEFTAGVRYTHDTRKSFGETFVFPVGFPEPQGPDGAAPPALSGDFYATTWNVALAYALSPDINLYGTVRKGYKAGGFNATAPSADTRFFQPEYVTDYELGAKTNWQVGEWLVRANGAVFYDDYTDIQRFVNLPTVPASTVTKNAASGTLKGIELDLLVSPSPLLDVSLAYSFIDGKYNKYDDAALGDLSDSKFPNTPRQQLTFTPVVHLPIPENMGKLSVLANVYYQSKMATDPANVPNGSPQVALSSEAGNLSGYTKVDLRADWQQIYGSKISAAAYVLNATDKEYKVGSSNQLSGFFGVSSYLYSIPRMYGVEVRYAFGD
ncbi:MAG: TonB-dependent receptor [Verrucomicrobiaceae bacterium]|nr:TonB-dependent receptor [Verrucomicrobiaceae bacterium]